MSSPIKIGVRLAGKNTAAQAAAAKRAAVLVTNIANETRLAVRALIARSIREGIPPVEAARLIRSMVGLSQRAAHAVMNYREAMINLGHTPAKVNALVDRYVAKKIRERAITVARTETMAALNAGQLANWNEAKKAGVIGKDAMVEWITTEDERLCEVCAPMDGESVALGESFSVPGPPAHPRCRCTIALAPGAKKSA